MKSLFSATAALALMVAAGQAGAQTADKPSDTSSAKPAMTAPMSPSSTDSMSPDTTNSDSAAAKPDSATQPAVGDKSASATDSAASSQTAAASSRIASANRREAKITDKLNEQELSQDITGKDASSMSGSSSQPEKTNSSWKAGDKQESTQPADTMGSGSSLGATPSPNAGSDATGSVSPNTGDKAAAPDSAAPESTSPMTPPAGNGQ